jgi:hypothetical protein
MSDAPSDASGGEPTDDGSETMNVDGVGEPRPAPPSEEPATPAPQTPTGPAETNAWWRIEPERLSHPQEAPAAGSPPSGTPPSGTPPYGTPPPYGAPGSQPPGTPGSPGAAPPWSTPPWSGTPQWGPQWSGWGPGWPGPPGWGWQAGGWQGGPLTPGASSASPLRRPIPWVVIGALLAGVAMVALGLGIGYSVWGGSATAPARSSTAARLPPRVSPSIGRGGFLGVEVAAAGFAPATSPPTSTSTTTTTPTTPGARVVAVVPSSPAAKAGIVKGDTITEFATKTVSSALTLRIDVLQQRPGSRVKVGWVTASGKHESAMVTLARRPGARSIG